MPSYRNIVILTGSGISAESGISTFRDKGGIWSRYDYRDVATPEGFERNPELVYEFYNMRRGIHATVQPNAAHVALARLEREHDGEVLIVTQNVDSLHERAGSSNVIHMHGRIGKVLCHDCRHRKVWQQDLHRTLTCDGCGKAGTLRPDVVWFGETPYELERIGTALKACDLFISVGTSGTVYPAASFVALARARGARTVELNLEASEGRPLFHEAVHGPATAVVPEFVERVLAG